MSDSDDFVELDDKVGDMGFLFQRKVPVSLKILAKDVEISKVNFLSLMLILNSLTLAFFAQIGFDIRLAQTNPANYSIYSSLLVGFVFGMILSVFLVDKVTKPLTFLKYLLLIAFVISIFEILLISGNITVGFNILLITNTAIIVFGLMISFKLFLVKTTILERGRVWAYLFIENMGFIVMSLITLIFNLAVLIPAAVVPLTVIYLHLKRKEISIDFSTSLTSPIKRKRAFKKGRYYLFFAMLGLTAGIATYVERFIQIVSETFQGNIALVILIILIIGIISSLILGLIFDYGGRMATLSFILLIIAIATYFGIFRFTLRDFPSAVILVSYVAAIMTVPLLIGDIARRKNYGKILTVSYFILGFGLIAGILLRMFILNSVSASNYAYDIIIGSTFMACIGSFVIIVSMRETLPSAEQDWKEYLIHLYIIHQSGILLYQYAFLREDDLSSPDLVSGGIVGLKSILKEIVKGEKEVQTIDHGDRKIMFKTNSSNDVIFALVVKEQLIVLRRKLDALIEDFDQYYLAKVKDIDTMGMEMDYFKDIKLLVRKYFGY